MLEPGKIGQGGTTAKAEADGRKHVLDARESKPCSAEACTLNLRIAKENIAEVGVVADQSSVTGTVKKGNVGDSLVRASVVDKRGSPFY